MLKNESLTFKASSQRRKRHMHHIAGVKLSISGAVLALFVGWCGVAPLTAIASIITEERYVYYDVEGDSAAALRSSINRERARLQKRFDALTSWNIRWQFSFTPTQQKCKITDVSIKVDIEYLLPRWPRLSAHSNEQLVNRWLQYTDELLKHERSHGRLVKAAIPAIERVIYSADDTSNAPATCPALERLANKNAQKVVSELEAQNRLFDLKTDHGRATGATFP